MGVCCVLTVVHFEVEGGGVRHPGLHGGQGALVRLQGEEDVLQVLNTCRRSAHTSDFRILKSATAPAELVLGWPSGG